MESDSKLDDRQTDFSGALARLGGNKTLFTKIAYYFLGTSLRTVEDLQHSLRNGAMQEAIDLMHNLKGLAASAGLSAVSDMARRMESDLLQSAPSEILNNSARQLESALISGNAELSAFAGGAAAATPSRDPN